MWALIVNNTVQELTDIDPSGRFHPSMEWVSVDNAVEVGMVRDGKNFAHLAEPEADLQLQINAEARAYLATTDWYIIRLQETGEPVPDEVLALRGAARARVVGV